MIEGDFPFRRILLDCTDTHFAKVNTGIQRVVRNLARNAPLAAANLGLECFPVVASAHGFVAAQCLPRPGFWGLPAPPDRSWAARHVRAVTTRLRKIFVPRTLCRQVGAVSTRWFGRLSTDPEVQPGPGDFLVLLDMHLPPTLAAAKERGAVVGQLIHDVLPVDHPEWFSPRESARFRQWLPQITEAADFFIANSQCTAASLRRYLDNSHPACKSRLAPILPFRLGSTLDTVAVEEMVRHELKELFGTPARQATYLTVGTIEPRKNHRLILDAFDRAWKTAPDARLCIVGRVGWLCDELIRRVRRHPRHGRTLFMFHDLDDTELQYCYRRARAVIFAAHAEGFGLPVAEALRLNVPVLVSDIPAHREVGGDCCSYFSPQDPSALAELVADREARGAFPPVFAPDLDRFPDWQTSSEEFVMQCLDAASSLRHREIAEAAPPAPRRAA